MDEDDAQFGGYVEVKAVEDPSGIIKDEIMIVVPLPEPVEKALDEDPLYYYPPSTPKCQQLYDDSSDSSDDSDSDEEFDDFDLNPRSVIFNPHKNNKTKDMVVDSKLDPALEYSFMEELMQTLDNIFGCSYGGCTEAISQPVLKSALRRKGASDYVPPINRNVSFTKLEIREFNMTLGDHPSAVSVRNIEKLDEAVCTVYLVTNDVALILRLHYTYRALLLCWTGMLDQQRSLWWI